jgi:serine/threonine-protein kinase
MASITEALKAALADRYVIEQEIGAGGMATVYLAHDVKHDRKVALKVLRPELAAVIGAERFLNEIKVTANLQHPHILPLHDSGEADTFLYYVMPFVEGDTLRDKLEREKQLGVDDAIGIARGVAAALDYAHRKGVIHRDIKPENVLIHDGQPLVADFGIALAVSAAGGSRLTETGLSVGTPQYMSPEQAMGDRELDARSDVYSLGAMLYEMLTGDPPYQGSTAQAIVAKVITEKAPSATATRDTVPPHVDAAIQKSLAKLPADRFPSAAQFAETLTDTSFTLPREAATAALVAEPASRRWNPLSVGLAALAALLLVSTAWGWLRSMPPPVSRHRIVLWDFETQPGAIRYGTAIAPDGSIVLVDSVAGGTQLVLKERDRLEPIPLAGTEDAGAPFFSPDGAWIGFFTDGKLRKVPRGGGGSVTLADTANTITPNGAWLDDGTILFIDRSFNLRQVNEAGGETEVVVSAAEILRGVVDVSPLPGGKGAFFTACNPGCGLSNVYVFDARADTARMLFEQAWGIWYAPTGHAVYMLRDGGAFAAPFDIEALELSGSAVPVLEGARFPDLVFSTTGTLIYAAGGGFMTNREELVWVDRNGTAEIIDPGWIADFEYLDLSPDGTRLAVAIEDSEEQRRQLWVKELDRGPLSKLTFEGSVNYRAAWTPDGRSIAFVSNRTDKDAPWIRRADGSGSAELLLDIDEDIWEVAWSPDGRWLVYRTAGHEGAEIYGFRPGVDTVPVRLVSSEFNDIGPALSPDGRWLAYASDESGQFEVYVRPFPDTRDAKWQVSDDGGQEPLWAHSGRELFYRSGSELVAAEIIVEPMFSIGERRTLFSTFGYETDPSHRTYDVSTDDERFVMIRYPRDETSGKLVLVENWFEELKERVSQ